MHPYLVTGQATGYSYLGCAPYGVSMYLFIFFFFEALIHPAAKAMQPMRIAISLIVFSLAWPGLLLLPGLHLLCSPPCMVGLSIVCMVHVHLALGLPTNGFVYGLKDWIQVFVSLSIACLGLGCLYGSYRC